VNKDVIINKPSCVLPCRGMRTRKSNGERVVEFRRLRCLLTSRTTSHANKAASGAVWAMKSLRGGVCCKTWSAGRAVRTDQSTACRVRPPRSRHRSAVVVAWYDWQQRYRDARRLTHTVVRRWVINCRYRLHTTACWRYLRHFCRSP